MTITSDPPRTVLQSQTGPGPYNIIFKIFSSSELNVYKNGTLITSGYTLSSDLTQITFTTDLISTDVVVLSLASDVSQPYTFPKYGTFPADKIELAFDNLTNLVKVINDRSTRIVKKATSGTIRIIPLVAEKLLIVNSDGSIGFSENSILDLDDFLDQVAAIPGGIDGLTTNTDIIAVAGFISSVSALAGIITEINGVAGNTANINAVLALKETIDTVAANAATITALAGGAPSNSAVHNYCWNGEFIHNRRGKDFSFLSPLGSDRLQPISSAWSVWTDSPVDVDILKADDEISANKVRLLRQSTSTGFKTLRFVIDENYGDIRGQTVTLGFRYKTAANFTGNIACSFRSVNIYLDNDNTPALSKSAASLTTSPHNAGVTNTTLPISQSFAPTVGGSTPTEVIYTSTTIPANAAFGIICIAVEWTSPTIPTDPLEEWVEIDGVYLVAGTFTSRPSLGKEDEGVLIMECGARCIRTKNKEESYKTNTTLGQIKWVTSIYQSSRCATFWDTRRLQFLYDESSIEMGSDDTVSFDMIETVSPLDGTVQRVVRGDTGNNYNDGVVLSSTDELNESTRQGRETNYRLNPGVTVEFHIDYHLV
jgi:hypothetical protein